EHAGVERDRLAWLEINLHGVPHAELADQTYQTIHVVAVARDVVSAAKVDPLHAGDELPEPALECVDRAREWREVVFEQRVEMQTADALEFSAKLRLRDAQARMGRAWVVERILSFGMLGIHAQAEAQLRPTRTRLSNERLEELPLGKRVEHHVIRDLENLGELV